MDDSQKIHPQQAEGQGEPARSRLEYPAIHQALVAKQLVNRMMHGAVGFLQDGAEYDQRCGGLDSEDFHGPDLEAEAEARREIELDDEAEGRIDAALRAEEDAIVRDPEEP